MRCEYRPDANDQTQLLQAVKPTSRISKVRPEPLPHDHLHIAAGLPGGVTPDFVKKFERELHSKPGLAPDVCYFFDYSFDADGSRSM